MSRRRYSQNIWLFRTGERKQRYATYHIGTVSLVLDRHGEYSTTSVTTPGLDRQIMKASSKLESTFDVCHGKLYNNDVPQSSSEPLHFDHRKPEDAYPKARLWMH